MNDYDRLSHHVTGFVYSPSQVTSLTFYPTKMLNACWKCKECFILLNFRLKKIKVITFFQLSIRLINTVKLCHQ